MSRRALEKLGERVTILTPEEPGASASLLSFRLASTPFDTLHTVLREKHHIITRMVPENGVNCIRVSTHIYNSEAEVRHLVDAIAAIA